MATIISRLQKGAGWGPLKVHHKGLGRLITVRKSPKMDWYKVIIDTNEGTPGHTKVREFSLGMERAELERLRDLINNCLEHS